MTAVLLMAAALFGVGLLVFWMEPLAVLSVIERLTPNITYRVRIHRPVVALSFDDGPHPTFTLQVLDILRRHDAKATFFLIGERAARHPDVVFQIKAAGHEVGNHYFKNCPTLGYSDANFVDYLEQTEKAIGIVASMQDRSYSARRVVWRSPSSSGLPKRTGTGACLAARILTTPCTLRCGT